MKQSKPLVGKLFAILIAMSILLTSCATQGIPVAVTAPNIPETQPNYQLRQSIRDHIALMSDENRTFSRESLFLGEGAGPAVGGDELVWYFSVFDMRADSIHDYIMDIAGREAWDRWRAQFAGRGGTRNRRELTLISFIEDHNITKEDIISAQELTFNRPREEIEELSSWARYGIPPTITEPCSGGIWRVVYSLSEIEALFSGNVHQLMEAFPGHGVVQNNRGYSPEWILNNIERAVLEEQIPMEDIWRIINRAEPFEQLDAVVAQAKAILEGGLTGLTLDPTEAVLHVGETLTIEAFVLPETDSIASWVSSDPSVAAVDSYGVVTGVSVGTATITATTADGEEATSEILVVGGDNPNIGDVNGDGVVDFLDLLVLIYYLDNNGNISAGTEFVRENADLNGDGVIDDLDLEILWQICLDNVR